MTAHKLKLYSVVYGDCALFRKKGGTSLNEIDRRTDGEIQDEVYKIAFVKANTAIGVIGDYIKEIVSVEDQVNGVALTSFGTIVHYETAIGEIGDSSFVSCYRLASTDAVGAIDDKTDSRITSISHQSVGVIQDSVKHDWVKHVHSDTAGEIQDGVDTNTVSGLWKRLYPKFASWG